MYVILEHIHPSSLPWGGSAHMHAHVRHLGTHTPIILALGRVCTHARTRHLGTHIPIILALGKVCTHARTRHLVGTHNEYSDSLSHTPHLGSAHMHAHVILEHTMNTVIACLTHLTWGLHTCTHTSSWNTMNSLSHTPHLVIACLTHLTW